MPGLSNFAQAKVLEYLIRNAPLYCALFVRAPDSGDGSGAVEVTGGGYDRLPMGTAGQTGVAWSPTQGGSPTTVTNAEDIAWKPASGDWSDQQPVAGWGLYDAPSGGNLVWSGVLTKPKIVYEGDTFMIGKRLLILTIA
jgi:hypothetical protein